MDRRRLVARNTVVAEICARQGLKLTPATLVETEHIGMTCFAYVGDAPYSVLARHEDRGVETIVYVSAALAHA